MRSSMIVLMAAAVAILGATRVHAAGGPAKITDATNKHNFSVSGPNGGYVVNGTTYTAATECNTCHTPHKAKKAPLWKRSNTATYALYNDGAYGKSVSMVYLANGDFLTTKSALCLSCHDGTQAVGGTVYMRPYDAGTGQYRGNFGTNLTNAHPIGVVYDQAKAGFKTLASMAGGKVAVEAHPTLGNVVSCTSCHDPHGTGEYRFTKKGPGGQGMCITCHDK